MSQTSNVFDTVQEVFATVTQEITVILVFFISLLLWRYVGQRQKELKKQQKLVSPHYPSKPMMTSKKVVEQTTDVIDGKAMQAIQQAESQMLKLLEQREFTRALNFFRTFERNGRDRLFSEALFSSFIQSAIRVGKIDVVERLLRSMKQRPTEPTGEFWRTTLKMLSSRKHFDACMNVYQIFGSSLPADKVVFSCLINGALENAAPERAASMLERYCEAGLEPKDYVLLFRTYVAVNDVDAAEKAFRELGSNMTSIMVNLVLLTCVKAKDPERAYKRLQEAHSFQENRAKAPDGNAAEEEPIVDVVSYNTVIKGFAQSGLLARCFDCLTEMRARNLEPDDVTFGTLLDMCIADNDMGAANEVVNLLMNGDRPVDTVMCTLFIKGLVRAQKLPKAIELYEEMKRRNSEGTRPDIVTYSVLIKACVDTHDLERALLFVEDMLAAGLSPDDIILTHLLEGCRYVGNHDLGKKLFDDIVAAGVKPSNYTLITMVKLHGRCGAHDDAYRLVANWEKQYGQKPSVIHYTCLMSGCLRTRNYDQAWQAYQLMLSMHVQPDETTMATLLPGMVAAQHWERVLMLTRSALKPGASIPIAGETLNNALAQIRAASGQSQLADELQILMQTANVRLNARNAAGRKPPGLC